MNLKWCLLYTIGQECVLTGLDSRRVSMMLLASVFSVVERTCWVLLPLN